MISLGIPKLFYEQVTAPIVTIEVRPPIGWEWLFQWLVCNCDETGKVLHWTYKDTEGHSIDNNPMSTGTTALQLFSPNTCTQSSYPLYIPLKLTNVVYLIASGDAITAGKILSVRGYYLLRPENLELNYFDAIAKKMGVEFDLFKRRF